jgi:DNA-binding response OmpR family regulator
MQHQILIVDDDPAARELLSRCLRRKRFDVATASTGFGAMELLDEWQFDLAILDADLKGECALDLLRRLKSRHGQLPVIILSGSPDEELPRKVFAAGANGFLHKKDSLNKLFVEVSQHISA